MFLNSRGYIRQHWPAVIRAVTKHIHRSPEISEIFWIYIYIIITSSNRSMQNLLASAGGAVQQASSIKTAFILWLVKHLTGPSWQLAVMHSIAQPCVQQLTNYFPVSLSWDRTKVPWAMPGIQKRSIIPHHNQQLFPKISKESSDVSLFVFVCARALYLCRLCMQRQNFKLLGHGLPFSSFTVSSAPYGAILIQSELAMAAVACARFAAATLFPCILWSIAAAVGASVHIRELPSYLFVGRLWQVPNYKGNAMAFQRTAQ